jgi:ubiquinone biosynthesis protein UbiJ
MRLQTGDIAKVQADIVAQAIIEIEVMGCRIEELGDRLQEVKYLATALEELKKRGVK